MQTKCNKSLESLGQEGEIDDLGKRQILISTIDTFSKAYKAQIDGQSKSEITIKELSDGVRLDLILNADFKVKLNAIQPLVGVPGIEILMGIRNALPVSARMITPEDTLNFLIRNEIKNWSQ